MGASGFVTFEAVLVIQEVVEVIGFIIYRIIVLSYDTSHYHSSRCTGQRHWLDRYSQQSHPSDLLIGFDCLYDSCFKLHCVVLEGVLQAIVWHEQSEAQSNRAHAAHCTNSSIKYGDPKCEIWRRAYQQALLRWHPDKMLHR